MYSTVRRMCVFVLLLFVSMVVLSACTVEQNAQEKETETQQNNYKELVEKEAAKAMTNPKTRETINFWVDTWNKKDQLAYVYLQNSSGDMIGYYVLDGPPVSMCAMLTPNYKIETKGTDGIASVPAPGIDGVYRGGEDCSRYFGKDATNDAYVEFTVGMGINMLLYTEPLSNHPNVDNLAPIKEDE